MKAFKYNFQRKNEITMIFIVTTLILVTLPVHSFSEPLEHGAGRLAIIKVSTVFFSFYLCYLTYRFFCRRNYILSFNESHISWGGKERKLFFWQDLKFIYYDLNSDSIELHFKLNQISFPSFSLADYGLTFDEFKEDLTNLGQEGILITRI